jgi:hypothetical protein
MEFSEIRDAIRSFDMVHPEKLKRYIHYRSFQNFVRHFDEIRDDKTKLLIISLLSKYVEDVNKRPNHDFSARKDWARLVNLYLLPVSSVYRKKHGFGFMIPLVWILVIGLIGDAILYLLESFFHAEHILCITVGMLLYYCYNKFAKEPMGRVYGIKY